MANSQLTRRDALKVGAIFADPLAAWAQQAAARRKRVIVAGGGLAGLICAYELHKRGHEVTVLEAGAEHFTKPGYEICWNYFQEFHLPVLDYPHREKMLRVVDGRMISEEEAAALRRSKSAGAGFNQRELESLKRRPDASLSSLYLDRYIERITDEYQPFGIGLDELDSLSVTDLLKRDGASEAAIQRLGSENSALHTIWKSAILRIRNVSSNPRQLYRIRGGNATLPETLARQLGDSIRRDRPVTAIRHDSRGVSVTCRFEGRDQTVDGDYLVCAMNALTLRKIPATPAWPEAKQYAMDNIPYTVETRLIFQSATKFWKRDGYTGNMDFGPPVGNIWPMAEEVATQRGLLIGTSPASMTTKLALTNFRRYYPGKSADIERSMALDWSHDPWAMACEARTYRPGELRRIWPAVIEPVGRVWFAGAYCDNNSWGMEAASRSAVRVARAIHEA
jgi:monoamine oxidase